jgi:hypothetical protein
MLGQNWANSALKVAPSDRLQLDIPRFTLDIYQQLTLLFVEGWAGIAGRSGDRMPVGARISAPVYTSPGTHPASCKMGTGSVPGLKRPGRSVRHPLPSSAEVEERVDL